MKVLGKSPGRALEFLLVIALNLLLQLQRDSLGNYFMEVTVFV